MQGWDSIHKDTEHGLAICFDTSRVEIIKEFSTSGNLQLLPVLLKVENEQIFLLLLYRPPGSAGTFVYELMQQISMLSLDNYGEYRTLIVGDFNLDQMADENVRLLQPIIDSEPHLHQRSKRSTHKQGGILDLVYDSLNMEPVRWLPSPYRDHFVMIFN